MPLLGLVEAIGIVEGMSGFVAQIAQDLVVGFRLDAFHQFILESAQPLIGKVEGDADRRDAIRTAPFVREIHLRPQVNAAALELAIELMDQLLQMRSFDGEPELVNLALE